MEFCKKDIHTDVLIASKYSQLTIDDDFNIPDTKEDIDKIIAGNGYIVVNEVASEEGRVKVIGSVYFKAIYKTLSEQPDIEVYEGEIPFEDHVNVDGISRMNRSESRCRLEDLTVSMINSRKLEVRGLIGNGVNVYDSNDVNCATDLIGGQGMECLYKDISMTDMVISKNDIFKIKEELDIQDSKPNIKQLLWSYVDLKNVDIKPLDNKISIRGELETFVIYKGEEEHLPIQYVFSVRSIYKEIDCQGSREGMVLEAECCIGKGDVCIHQDKDGEDRVLAVDYSANMNIKMYEDKQYHILYDIFSPSVDVRPVTQKITYENLIMRNSAKAKLSHRHRIGHDRDKLMSLCHVYGNVDMDDIEIHDENVQIRGVVKVNVLYVSASEDPLSCMQLSVPFDYAVDTAPLSKEDSVRITPSLDMLNVNMLNSEELEIKAQVNLGISIFERASTEVIVDMTVEEIDYEKKAAMPGIVGYIVKKDDTIWSIARKYYATTESIRTINGLDSDVINEGDRIIVVKS